MASEIVTRVRTPVAQRNGDFSSCVPACPQLYNPDTGAAFPNNQIPLAMFDPAAAKVLAQLPIPDNAEGRVTIPRDTDQDSNQLVLKVDQQLGINDQLSVRYFMDDFNTASRSCRATSSVTAVRASSDAAHQNIVDAWKRTLSADAAQRIHLRLQPPEHRAAAASGRAGDSGLRRPSAVSAATRSISEIQAVGYFNIGDNLEARFPRDGFQFITGPTGSKARHSIQFGAEFEYVRPEIYNDYRRAGHFQFDGRFTRAPGAASGGNALADFMLGRLRSFDHGTGEYKNYRNLYQTYFFQDDLKVSDRVTLEPWARATSPRHPGTTSSAASSTSR